MSTNTSQGTVISVEKIFQFGKISQLDLPAPVCIDRNKSLGVVLEQMRIARVSCVLVCDGKDLLGIFTTRDVLNKVVGTDANKEDSITQFMTPSPTTISVEASIAEAIQAMDSAGVRHIPLLNSEGEIKGMISADHIVSYLVEHFANEIYNLPPRLQQKIMTAEGA
jgi:CBS domain-containing protein